MAERGEETETGVEQAVGQDSPAAVALALGSAKPGARLPREAAVFLTEQTDLVRLQKEHLHEQRELQTSRLRLGRWKDRTSLALQLMTALIGLAFAAAIAVMAWHAHEDHGLVIDAFSVPPDLARGGLTGEVVAARFLDKLQAMQTATKSDRPANTFQNNWGEDIKLEVPETGLTFGELEKLLRDKLGHASHITGEVYDTPAGVALTARFGDDPPKTFEGPAASLDALEQQAAEAVYRNSQPYRFAQYLEQHGRVDEAFAVISDLATKGPPSEQGWAYAQWALFDVNDHGDLGAARVHAQHAVAQAGASMVEADIALIAEEVWSGHDEAALAASRDVQRRAQRRSSQSTEAFFIQTRLVANAWLASLVGDQRLSASDWRLLAKTPDTQFIIARSAPALAATADELGHDPQAARVDLASMGGLDDTAALQDDADNAFLALPGYRAAAERGDWRAALADAQTVDAWLGARAGQQKVFGLLQAVWIAPLQALAQARAGDIAGAEALIGTTPLDCYLCLRVRGQIAAEKKDWTTAGRWFAEATRQGPSLPFAYAEWGQMLLAKGDPDGAIAKLRIAHEQGPYFADPVELWGEALMRKGDYAGAAAKFEAATKDAPNWGRNRAMLRRAKAQAHG